jgi:predicted enzyme related to lactoylglutathione lyase
MKASHIHVGVRDLAGALEAFERLWSMSPVYQNERMATLRFGEIGILLDSAERDAELTIAFDSSDCERDFARVVELGAQVLEAPQKKPWGVYTAYLRGPGAITFEIEQVLE